jgi:hypothetical protein
MTPTYWRSAAGARGSEATDKPVSCNVQLGSPLGASFTSHDGQVVQVVANHCSVESRINQVRDAREKANP